MARTATGESSLARAVRILDAFTPEEPALPVSVLARRAGLHVATASRLVAELVAQGLLTRGPDREVRIGLRMWELAARASPTLSLRDAAMPFLEDVHAVVGHHAQLGVRDGDEVLFVERLTARDAVINYSRIAGRLPLHVTLVGHGAARLRPAGPAGAGARPSAAAADRPDAAHPGRSCARRWRRSAGRATRCSRARARGGDRCRRPGADALGEVVAGLSVIVPNDGRAAAHVPVLQAAARGLSRALARVPAPALTPSETVAAGHLAQPRQARLRRPDEGLPVDGHQAEGGP